MLYPIFTLQKLSLLRLTTTECFVLLIITVATMWKFSTFLLCIFNTQHTGRSSYFLKESKTPKTQTWMKKVKALPLPTSIIQQHSTYFFLPFSFNLTTQHPLSLCVSVTNVSSRAFCAVVAYDGYDGESR